MSTKTRRQRQKTLSHDVRHFKEADKDAIVELLATAGFDGHMDSVTDAPDVRLVVSSNNKIVGHVALSMISPRCKGDGRGGSSRHRKGGRTHISSLVVHPNYRRQGIGKALLRTAKRLSRQAGFPWLELDVTPNNTAAVALYKSMGFKEPVGVFLGPVGSIKLRCRT